MNNTDELYKRKGEAHTQVEIWQQVLKEVNQKLSNALSENIKGINNAIAAKEDKGDSKKSTPPSDRNSSPAVPPK